jgi:putative NADH-flavin reductase
MILAIFGGTGRAGQLLVRDAVTAGHNVVVLARTPSKLDLSSDLLRVIRGDALDPRSVRETVAGADAIISLLGPEKDAPPLAVSRATANIIAAAGDCRVSRLLATAGAGVGDALDRPGLADKLIVALLRAASRDAYTDMGATARGVRASGLDWTLVRVPRLTDDAARGAPKAGYLGRGAGMRLSRSGLAAFLLAHATDTTFVHRAPVVSD